MAHVDRESFHAFRARALDVQVDVDTDVAFGSFSNIRLRIVGVVTKTGLVAVTGGTGILIGVALTAADLDVAPGIYDFELLATVGGQVRTLAQGAITVSDEPTPGA